jgi:hypothetical protein
VQPHSRNTARKEFGIGAVGALGTVDVIRNNLGWILSTEQNSSISSHRPVDVLVWWFSFLAVLEYTSIVAEPATE